MTTTYDIESDREGAMEAVRVARAALRDFGAAMGGLDECGSAIVYAGVAWQRFDARIQGIEADVLLAPSGPAIVAAAEAAEELYDEIEGATAALEDGIVPIVPRESSAARRAA